MDDHIIFIALPGRYTPAVDEPSPFGPDQENYKDNPWLLWKRKQPGYDERVHGSATLLREALIEQIKSEKPRTMMERGQSTPVMSTTDGEVSLAMVLWMKDAVGPATSIEEVHRVLAGKLARWKTLDQREFLHETIYGRPV
jgi:hypothetical protein